MKVLVTGAKGVLGRELCAQLPLCGIGVVPADAEEFDVTDRLAAAAFFKEHKPDAVIHCAAYTAVDKAQTDSERCFAVNVTGTMNVALAAKNSGAKLLLPSTDYVFDGSGTQPHKTDEQRRPLSVYGVSKMMAEDAVLATLDRCFIVRLSWLFGKTGSSFVRTMLRLGAERAELRVVDDQTGSPTCAADLAALMCEMITTESYGVYHATNEGVCTWAQFAREIMAAANLGCEILPVTTEEYGAAAPRPKNSRLDKSSLDRARFARLRPYGEAMRELVDYFINQQND